MRLWQREGLKVPEKQPKRGRMWLNDGSCILDPSLYLIARQILLTGRFFNRRLPLTNLPDQHSLALRGPSPDLGLLHHDHLPSGFESTMYS